MHYPFRPLPFLLSPPLPPLISSRLLTFQVPRDGMPGRTDHAPPAPPSTLPLYGLVPLDGSGLLLPHRCVHYLTTSTMTSVYPLLHIDWHHFLPSFLPSSLSQGLQVFSLDESMQFAPTDLDITITPQSVTTAINKKVNYFHFIFYLSSPWNVFLC